MTSPQWDHVGVFVQNRDFYGTRILHIPVLHELRQRFERLTVFAPYHTAEDFRTWGLADDVVVYPADLAWITRELRRRQLDQVVSLRSASARISAACFLAGIRVRMGFAGTINRMFLTHVVPRTTRIYRAENFLDVVREHVPGDIDRGTWLRSRLRALQKKSPTVVLMPGGGSGAFKRWGLREYIDLADSLHRAASLSAVWVLGPGEREDRQQLLATIAPERNQILFEADLATLASHVAAAALVVSNDCGPSHIAHLLRAPQVCLFSDHDGRGADRVAEWFDPRPNSRVLLSPPGTEAASIALADVLEGCRSVLDRAPAKAHP